MGRSGDRRSPRLGYGGAFFRVGTRKNANPAVLGRNPGPLRVVIRLAPYEGFVPCLESVVRPTERVYEP